MIDWCLFDEYDHHVLFVCSTTIEYDGVMDEHIWDILTFVLSTTSVWQLVYLVEKEFIDRWNLLTINERKNVQVTSITYSRFSCPLKFEQIIVRKRWSSRWILFKINSVVYCVPKMTIYFLSSFSNHTDEWVHHDDFLRWSTCLCPYIVASDLNFLVQSNESSILRMNEFSSMPEDERQIEFNIRWTIFRWIIASIFWSVRHS